MEQVLGETVTFLYTVCYIPQMVKTYRIKTIDGISSRFLIIFYFQNRDRRSP
ncbi:MAG: PQ-loop repeat-containing protein [Candidatus Omnitrophica bacterium]|nr:PQ-loop repeat-containing protein [Candidatus Omnitrophota bacterium]